MSSDSCLNHGFNLHARLAAMSYTVTVSTQGGEVRAEASGEVPDGTFVIQGHTEGVGHELAVRFTSRPGQRHYSGPGTDTGKG